MGLVHLAQQPEGTVMQPAEIFQKLTQYGLVRSLRSTTRPYNLSRSTSEITLRDVLEDIEGPGLLNGASSEITAALRRIPVSPRGMETDHPQANSVDGGDTPKITGAGLRLCEYKGESADLFLILIVRRSNLSLISFTWEVSETYGASEPQYGFLWFREVAYRDSSAGKRCPIIDAGAARQSLALHTLQIKQNQKVEGSFPVRHGSDSPWPNDC